MSSPVDYATPTAVMPRTPPIGFSIVLLFLAALVVFTCVRIEILNAYAGFYLPRKDFPAFGNDKWRTALHPATPAQIANKTLHDTISSFGLLQYPLTALLLVSLPVAFRQHSSRLWRHILAAAFLLDLICIALMFYRGYFTSLGW